MGQIAFTAQVVLHWMGPDDGWEVCDRAMQMDVPYADVDEGLDLLTEELQRLAREGGLAGRPGSMVRALAAGSLVYTQYETMDGPDCDVEAVVDWQVLRAMDEDEALAWESELGEPRRPLDEVDRDPCPECGDRCCNGECMGD